MKPEYLTPEQVAAEFQVTRAAVYKWITEGKLKAVKVGTLTRITRAAMEEFTKPVEPKKEDESPPR